MAVNDQAVSDAMSIMFGFGKEPAEKAAPAKAAMERREVPAKKHDASVVKEKTELKQSEKNDHPVEELSVSRTKQKVSPNGTIRVGFWITPELDKEIEIRKAQTGEDKSSIVERMLRQGLGMANRER